MFGAQMAQGVLEPMDKNKIFEAYKARAHNKNQAEHVRAGNAQLAPEKFIVAANASQGDKP